MGTVVYGKDFFGTVDRVPGEYHVATLFRHVQYLPLVPVGSFLVLEDESGRDTDDCRPIPLSGKSVSIAYLRALLALVVLFSGLMGALMGAVYFGGSHNPAAFLSALAAAAGLTWAAIGPRGWLFLPGQVLFHGLSAILLVARFALPAPALAKEEGFWVPLLLANVALLLYALTRLATGASADRAEELDELLDGGEATFEVVRPR